MPYPDLHAYLSNSVSTAFQQFQNESEADITRLNELLNNDVEIRGTVWEGANFETVTRQYQSLVGAMQSSPLFQSIAQEMQEDLYWESFSDDRSSPGDMSIDALKFFIKNRKMIMRAGWPGHAVLMELIDTGKSIQILVYNSGEGLQNHGNPQLIKNKHKYPPVYALEVNMTLSSIQTTDLDEILDNYQTYKKEPSWRSWRYYLPRAFKLRKQCQEFSRLHHFFTSVFKTKNDLPEGGVPAYYQGLKTFFKKQAKKLKVGFPLPRVKKIDLSGLGLYITPHRSGGCTIKVWFSAFQRFRAAISQLSDRQRKRYYFSKKFKKTDEDYAVTRLKTKCAVAFLAIQKQQNLSKNTLEYSIDNHKIIQNLLDAIKKLSREQAAQFAEEKALLDQLNHWLVSEVLPTLHPLKDYKQRDVSVAPPLTAPGKKMILPYVNEHTVRSYYIFPLSQAREIEKIDGFQFKTLSEYKDFLEYISNDYGENKLLLLRAIQQYAQQSSYQPPNDVKSLGGVADWVQYQFDIAEKIKRIMEDSDFNTITAVNAAAILEKIYLSVLQTLKKHVDSKHFDVSIFFNLERFNIENHAGFLGSPYLKELSRNNTVFRAGKIDFTPDYGDRISDLDQFLQFSKGLGVDWLGLFSDYCRDQDLSPQFIENKEYKIWYDRNKQNAKIAFIQGKIEGDDQAFKAFCQKNKIVVNDLKNAMNLLKLFFEYPHIDYRIEAKKILFLEIFSRIYRKTPVTSLKRRDVLSAKFKYLAKGGNSDPEVLKLLRKSPGNTEIGVDFESHDVHTTASFCHLTERELTLFKKLKHAYRSSELRWSEGLQILEELLPFLDNLSPEFMRMALSVIGSDDTDYSKLTQDVIHSQQSTLLNLLKKSERYLSDPEIHPAYFTYAALLQIFLIHHNPQDGTSWCEEYLKKYQQRIQEIHGNADMPADLVKSANAYQLLDMYRRLIINQDETHFKEDYAFFIQHLPNTIFTSQSGSELQYIHPDLNLILFELQQYWMKKWNDAEALKVMQTVIQDKKAKVSIGSDYISIEDPVTKAFVLFDPFSNKIEQSNPVPCVLSKAFLDSKNGLYFKKQGISNAESDENFYYWNKGDLSFKLGKQDATFFELYYDSKTYRLLTKSKTNDCLSGSYLNDDRYFCFIENNHTQCVVVDTQTLEIVYKGELSTGVTAMHFKKSSSAQDETYVPLSFYEDAERPTWLSFADPNYVEVGLERNQGKKFNCLQTGIQIEYRAGRWVCLQQPDLYCQAVPLTFKMPGFTGYLPLVSEDGTLKKVLVPRTPIRLENGKLTQQLKARADGYDTMEMSTFNYEGGMLHGRSIHDKLHAFYLYSLYGTNQEQSAAFQELLEGGSLDIEDPTIQHLLYLIFFGSPDSSEKEPTQVLHPHLSALRLRLLLIVFSKSMYAQAELDPSTLLNSRLVDADLKDRIKNKFQLPQLAIELSRLSAYYFDVERNLPHDKRLTQSEKAILDRLVATPYQKQYEQLQLAPGKPGEPVIGDRGLLEGNPDENVLIHFSDLLTFKRPDTPLPQATQDELAVDNAFLKEMRESAALVDCQQKNIESLFSELASSTDKIVTIKQQSETLTQTHKAGLSQLTKEIYQDWCALQTALGRNLSEPSGQNRENPSFDIQECIRALFFGELQTIQKEVGRTSGQKEAAKALQEKLTRYLLKSILVKRFQCIQDLCQQYHYEEDLRDSALSHNKGIVRKIAKVLLERQLPTCIDDLRFLIIGSVLGFCLTERQVLAVQDALTTGDCNQVLEAEMGFGKSEVVLTAIALMKGDKQPVLVLPKQLMSLTENAIAKTTGYFGYTFNRITYHREDNRNQRYFDFLLKLIESAREQKQIIVTDQGSLEALKLSYIEKCTDPNSDEASVRNLAKILQYCQMHVQATQDEFHESTLDKQFNYAEGDKVRVPEEIQTTMLKIYEMMKESSALSQYLIDPNLLVSVDHQINLKKELKRCYLEDSNSPLAALSLEAHQKHEFQQWLDDEIDTPDFARDSYVLQTCKYFSSFVAVNSLKKKANENFGRNPALGVKMQSMVPIPYVFNEVPALGSEFANPIQLTALTIQLSLFNPIPLDIFRAYCVEKQGYYKALRMAGKTESELASDPQLKIFFELGLSEALKKNMRHKDFWNTFFEENQNNYELKKAILKEEILPTIQIHNQYLNDTHQDFVAQIGHYHGVSGTPPKVILPRKSKINPEISKGVFLRVAQLLLKKNSPVYCAPTARLTLSNYFEQTREAVKDKLDRFRVIFDLDNDFQGNSTYQVAKHIHQWLNNSKEDALKNVKVVVFFEEDKAYYVSVQDKLAIKRPIQDIKAIDKELNLKNMNEAFVYFDQSHCVGVNMQLDSNVFALANTGPRVPISLYQQMIYRLRELEGEQTVTTVIDRSKQEIIQSTTVPEAFKSEACLHGANPELVQLLYHGYELMSKTERQGAPVAAQQSLHAILRNEILKKSYVAADPRSVIQASKALFYVDVDFMGLLQQGNAQKKPIPKEQYYAQLKEKYAPLLRQHTPFNATQIEEILQSVCEQYEPHSEQQILGNEQTMDATAQAQQQVQQSAQHQAQVEQMHQHQMQFGLQTTNQYTYNYFKHMTRWLYVFKFSLNRWLGGFFSLNQSFSRFKCDSRILVTGNHKHWVSSMSSAFKHSMQYLKSMLIFVKENFLSVLAFYGLILFELLPLMILAPLVTMVSVLLVGSLIALMVPFIRGGFFSAIFSSLTHSSYQDKDHNKNFSEILVIRQHGKLYSIACTSEDVHHVVTNAEHCELPFVLYTLGNKQVIASNNSKLCQLLAQEPTDTALASDDYKQLHSMRQQLRYLNGDLLALVQDEKHWFFADPTDSQMMQRLWACYEAEIKPYHAGEHVISREQFDEQIKTRINCASRADQARFNPGWMTRAWIQCKTLVSQMIRWLATKIVAGLSKVGRVIYHKSSLVRQMLQGVKELPVLNRYNETDEYIAEQVPDVMPLNLMLKHRKKSETDQAPRIEETEQPQFTRVELAVD